jgi:hypothetical protein
VVEKFNIDTKIQNTEQLVRKLVNLPTEEGVQGKQAGKGKLNRPGVEEKLEEQIEESLENLDNLLNNIKTKDPSKRE